MNHATLFSPSAADKDDTNPPSPSVPFKLGGTDAVSLYQDGRLISSLSWMEGDAPEGSSFGLLNGTAQILEPTPGAANKQKADNPNGIVRGKPTGNSPLRISEVVAQSDRPAFYESADWIELVNTGTAAVNLGDFRLTDDSSPLENLPARTLNPGERIVVIAGGSAPSDGTPHVTFGLGREDSISLFRGDEEVDYVVWGRDQSKNGRSYGRLNNNSEFLELYPTPGYENAAYVLFDRSKVFTARVDISPATWQSMVSARQEVYYQANFELNGAKIENVGFRIKGQGSLFSIPQGSKRFGFKVDMNRYVDQKFMGMKMLVFNQSFSDPSFMRDLLAYDLMRDAGVPAPEISYVDLYVAGEHLGLYQMIEMIDSEFVEKHFPEDEDDQGDLHKGELLQRLTLNGNTYANYREGLPLENNSSTVGTPNEGAALVRFIQDINSGDTALARSRVDIDLTIKYLAALVLTGNLDSPNGATANNFYLYERRSQNTFTYLPWDFNLGFGLWGNGPAPNLGTGGGGFGGGGFGGGGFGGGGFGGGGFGGTTQPAQTACRITNHVIDNPVHDGIPTRPMLDVILKDPALLERYRAELRRLIENYYNPQVMRTKIDGLATLIDAYVRNDPTKFFTYEEFRQSLDQGLPANSNISGGRGANIYGPDPGLLKFISEKSSNILSQLNGQLPSANAGGTAGSCPPGT